MSTYVTSQRVLRAAAVVFVTLVVAIAVIQGRPSENAAVLTRLEPGEADALVGELARCRTVTSDDAIVLEACRRLWAENRQHFFVSTNSPKASDPPAATEVTKSQERIPRQETDQREGR
jgi:conjugative transfer region protein TrbK